MDEWHRKTRFSSREEHRRSLYEFVERYNHKRVYGTILSTPIERLTQYTQKVEGGDNAR